MKKLIFTILGILVFCGLFAQEIPQKISYQGKLLEYGSPVTGTKSITFTIDTWTELHPNVSVTDGLYSVTLGETTPIPTNIFDNSTSVTLQISVEGVTLSPQTDILSVAYAYKAEKAVDAEKIAGNPVSGTPSTNQVLKWNGSQWIPQIDETLNGSQAGGDLSDNYPDPTVAKIQTHPVSPNAPGTGEILKWDGSEWIPQIDETLNGSPAGGDLSNTYPDPTVAKIQTHPVSPNAPGTGEILKWDGSEWVPDTDSAGGSLWTQNGDDIYYNTGSVLIGTTSGGNQKLKIETGSNNQGLKITNNSSNQIALRIDNNAGASRPLFIENASDESVYFGTSGNPSSAVKITNAGTGNALRIDNSNVGHGLYVVNSGSGYGGYFSGSSGNVVISGWCDIGGNLTKGGGSFKIDHPLDPENKYLYHSFVESPDMMNVYNGNIILSSNGVAIVELPEWFESLNMEFRYQLTCIGGFAPVYIAEKISNNRFMIAGGTNGLEVSWQVTGIRQDPYANQNRIQVEVEKTDKEKGHYLHYKEYKQPIEKSIEAVKSHEMLEELDKNK